MNNVESELAMLRSGVQGLRVSVAKLQQALGANQVALRVQGKELTELKELVKSLSVRLEANKTW